MKPKCDNDLPYGTPREGINPLTGKPRGPSRLRTVTPEEWGLIIISPAEPEVEDQTPPEQPTA